MNIFETLRHGKGSINEENISSFLGYLLNPNADHTLYDTFLKEFIKALGVKQVEIDSIKSEDIEISFEYEVESLNCTRYLDIYFETNENIIAIENKIKENSISKKQLEDEYTGLKASSDKPIIFCLLTPKANKFKSKFEVSQKDKFVHIYWEDVIVILKNILKADLFGDINPIDSYVKYTIKSFINFMNSAKHRSKIFYSNDNKYRIFKFSDNSIDLEYVINNEWVSVPKGYKKEIIKNALIENKIIPQEEMNSKFVNYTTYMFGRYLFNNL